MRWRNKNKKYIWFAWHPIQITCTDYVVWLKYVQVDMMGSTKLYSELKKEEIR